MDREMQKILITADTRVKKQRLGDMFGIFFEDLNHAADGGLYAEMIRNRSFEFDKIDNGSYNHLTAWKITGLTDRDAESAEDGADNRKTYGIDTMSPLSDKNPHYLTVEISDGESTDDVSIVNEGYNTGLYLEQGEVYNFSMYCRSYGRDMKINLFLTGDDGEVIARDNADVHGDGWEQYKCVFVPEKTTINGRLKIQPADVGKVSFDHVSMFPADTFLHKENGLRADIAMMLKELKPKFMRFPGGCLVHDGSLNADDRDSMYRWKNTVGDVTKRPARRNNWGYNQTLGLGYYEYFCFCEEIGAEPLPVLPGGYNPHRQNAVPLSEISAWTDDALDLIEFANGDISTKWGRVRAELGHEKPFGLKYIAIGNEEVGEMFFERYPYFHKAIKEKYPDIKVIGTSGPFAAGGEFERGWKSAVENRCDYVDEHYYMAPEWFLANIDRYKEYKEDEPKVFLGEYATGGNTYYNALIEAAYMTRLQENAHAVGLACYAPLLCNADYVNWRPDMIWFNNHQVYGTPNYYVQKMFMNHQGDVLLSTSVDNMQKPKVIATPDFSGELIVEAGHGTVTYSDISVENNDTGEIYRFEDRTLTKDDKKYSLMNMPCSNYTVTFRARQSEGHKGFYISFGKKDEKNGYRWELGGWQNLDAIVSQSMNGRGSCLTQSEFSVKTGETYELKMRVNENGVVNTCVGGELFQTVKALPVLAEDIYVTSSLEEETGDIIIKAVNIDDVDKKAKISLAGLENKPYTIMIEDMKGFTPDSVNSFDEPEKVRSHTGEMSVDSNVFDYTFEKESVTVLRVNVKCK